MYRNSQLWRSMARGEVYIRDNKLRSGINQPLLEIVLAVKMPSHQVDSGSQQRDLVRGITMTMPQLLVVSRFCKTKVVRIHNLVSRLSGYQYVFRLQITIYDSLSMVILREQIREKTLRNKSS